MNSSVGSSPRGHDRQRRRARDVRPRKQQGAGDAHHQGCDGGGPHQARRPECRTEEYALHTLLGLELGVVVSPSIAKRPFLGPTERPRSHNPSSEMYARVHESQSLVSSSIVHRHEARPSSQGIPLSHSAPVKGEQIPPHARQSRLVHTALRSDLARRPIPRSRRRSPP